MKKMIFIASILLAFDLAVIGSLVKLPDGMTVHMLDVGQGDAVLIQTPEMHNILIDGGPGNEVLMELAGTVPYLFGELDLVIFTHPHADHVEGLVPVLERFDVGAVILSMPEYGSRAYEAFLEQLEGMRVFVADDETDFQLGSVSLDVLYPFEPASEEMENVNNASPVIVAEWADWRILLTGDAEVEVEEAVLEAGVLREVDVLKAGHHGSRTASSEEWLEAAAADWMLISCGEDNSFEHPHAEVLERAAAAEMDVLRTDLNGRISVYFDEDGYSLTRSIWAPIWRSFSSNRS